MPFQTGNPGRPVGARKRESRALLAMTELGMNPFRVLAEVAHDPKVKARDRADAAYKLARFIEPTLQATALSDPDGNALTVHVLTETASNAGDHARPASVAPSESVRPESAPSERLGEGSALGRDAGAHPDRD